MCVFFCACLCLCLCVIVSFVSLSVRDRVRTAMDEQKIQLDHQEDLRYLMDEVARWVMAAPAGPQQAARLARVAEGTAGEGEASPFAQLSMEVQQVGRTHTLWRHGCPERSSAVGVARVDRRDGCVPTRDLRTG